MFLIGEWMMITIGDTDKWLLVMIIVICNIGRKKGGFIERLIVVFIEITTGICRIKKEGMVL